MSSEYDNYFSFAGVRAIYFVYLKKTKQPYVPNVIHIYSKSWYIEVAPFILPLKSW